MDCKIPARAIESFAMDCPVCKTPMIVLEYEHVEIDFCVGCEGIWLDSGELELLAGDTPGTARLLNAGAPHLAQNEKKRRCPICRTRMAKTRSESQHPVVYDKCPRGDGLWFDRGELLQLLDDGRLNGGDTVKAFLRGVFQKPDQES